MTVAGNGLGAILCNEEFFTTEPGGFCAIAGNNIGTDVIGANAHEAIKATNVNGSVISRNYIGTDTHGSDEIGNSADGIVLVDSWNNEIGGGTALGNVICKNNGFGIRIQGGFENRIIANSIGVVLGELSTIGKSNLLAGVLLSGTHSNLISTTNKISANLEHGIVLRNANSNRILGNLIGTDEARGNFGNLGDGVLISENSSNNFVGNNEADSGNVIAFNGGNGVNIDQTAGTGNVVDPNSIFGNGGLGIDLGSNGHSPNDPGDGDEGPNRQQNYPEITEFSVDTNGDLMISYRVDSLPANSNYGPDGLYVEFFISDTTGEGRTFLGGDRYGIADHESLTTGGRPWSLTTAGIRIVNLGNAAALGFGTGDRVTATATDADGNTSEFFPPFAPTAAAVTVGGRVTDEFGRGLANIGLTLTGADGTTRTTRSNSFGVYRFENVSVGETYVVMPITGRFVFAPNARVIDVSDALDNVNFTGTEVPVNGDG